jgi:hypothetical protein
MILSVLEDEEESVLSMSFILLSTEDESTSGAMLLIG